MTHPHRLLDPSASDYESPTFSFDDGRPSADDPLSYEFAVMPFAC